MPATPRPGKKLLYAEIPSDLYEQFAAHGKKANRSLRGELEVCMRYWLTMPVGFFPPEIEEAGAEPPKKKRRSEK